MKTLDFEQSKTIQEERSNEKNRSGSGSDYSAKSPRSLKDFIKEEDHFGNLSESPNSQDLNSNSKKS